MEAFRRGACCAFGMHGTLKVAEGRMARVRMGQKTMIVNHVQYFIMTIDIYRLYNLIITTINYYGYYTLLYNIIYT